MIEDEVREIGKRKVTFAVVVAGSVAPLCPIVSARATLPEHPEIQEHGGC
jgi:hypothetical protein